MCLEGPSCPSGKIRALVRSRVDLLRLWWVFQQRGWSSRLVGCGCVLRGWGESCEICCFSVLGEVQQRDNLRVWAHTGVSWDCLSAWEWDLRTGGFKISKSPCLLRYMGGIKMYWSETHCKQAGKQRCVYIYVHTRVWKGFCKVWSVEAAWVLSWEALFGFAVGGARLQQGSPCPICCRRWCTATGGFWSDRGHECVILKSVLTHPLWRWVSACCRLCCNWWLWEIFNKCAPRGEIPSRRMKWLNFKMLNHRMLLRGLGLPGWFL